MASTTNSVPSQALFVITKAPVPGKVKTRLCPPLSPEQAAALHGAFLQDTLELALTLPATAVKTISPSQADAASLVAILPPEVETCWQQGTGLGAGLEEAFAQTVGQQRFKAAAVLSSDNPDLDPQILVAGFAALEGADVVLGPSVDGGYYFIAARQVYPWLFREMVWSTPTVCVETQRRIASAGLTSVLLPPWFDIDTIADLYLLAQRLRQGPSDVASHTRLALARVRSHLQEQQASAGKS